MLTKFNLCKYFVIVSSFLILLAIQGGFATRQFCSDGQEESKILLTEAEELTERTLDLGEKEFKQVTSFLFCTYLKFAFEYSAKHGEMSESSESGDLSYRLFIRFHNLRIP